MSRVTISFLLFCFLLKVPFGYGQSLEIPCPYDKPTSFIVTDVGTTWISVSWSPFQGVQDYYVQIGFPNSSPFFTAITSNTSFTFTNLTPGTAYDVFVGVSCGNNIHGKLAYIDINTILVDLLTSFENYSFTNPTCIRDIFFPDNPVSCIVSLNIGNFAFGEFSDNNNQKVIRFGIKLMEGQDGQLRIKFGAVPFRNYPGIANYNWYFTTDLGERSGDNSLYINLTMNSYGDIGTFFLSWKNGNNYQIEYIAKEIVYRELNYTLKIYGDESLQIPNDRFESYNVNNSPNPSILPNPTTTTLQIQIPQTFTTPIQGTLLTLSGAVVQRYGLEPGVNTVSTANLSPGIYFLRLEGPGYAETFKVVKVE